MRKPGRIHRGIRGCLKVRLKAPLIDGKANQSLLIFLAKTCQAPLQRVSMLSGVASRDERIGILAPQHLPAGIRLPEV